MNTVNLETLKKDLTFTGDLYIGNNFIVLPHTSPVTENIMKALKEWDFHEFICEGSLSLGGDIGVSGNSDNQKKNKESSDIQNDSLKKALADSKTLRLGNSDKSRMDVVRSVYNEYMNYINSLFTRYVTQRQINQTELSDTVKDLIVFIKDNRRFILRVTPSVEQRTKNFLVAHSMRTTVLAITIGLQEHMPLSKLIELGVACILHEIGMVRLPPQLYMTDKKFSQAEKAQVMTHPILGYNILKELDFPMSIQLGVLEHHEKENGTGYPRQLSGDKIISYAKIIAVACTFEAITAPRSYKDERSTFDAMVEMLKNANHQYDDAAIKALLYSVSLFPIGAYVFLKNGKVAEVIDVNPDNPKLPVVQLLLEKDKDGSPKTIQTNDSDLAIVRVLNRKETEDVKASVEKMNAELEKSTPKKETSEKVESSEESSEPEKTPQEPVISGKKNADGSEDIDISIFS
ncbi:MAG: HD domain-containing protein [Treponema sp.]|nr:HD domain-containing protein [Treponema sp.]